MFAKLQKKCQTNKLLWLNETIICVYTDFFVPLRRNLYKLMIMKKIFLSVALMLSFVLQSLGAERVSATMFPRPEGGFVLVEDATSLIIGFSDKGSVRELSNDARQVFEEWGLDVRVSAQAPEAFLLTQLAAEVTDSVGPLLGDIKFGQGDPFRGKTPIRNNQHCLAGCVAVAMAQIMTYYRHPEVCHGSISYKTETLNITVSLDLEGYRIDWDNILPNYLNGYSSAQAEAVADLLYACGATTRMDYNLDGSGTNAEYVGDALVTFFGYSSDVESLARADYTDAKWYEILQTELKAGRPILMRSMQPSGAGHAYVMDGYYVQKGYEKYPYFHFNWGWEGKDDGWFLLNNLQAGDYDLRSNQEIIRYIMPMNGSANEIVETDAFDTAIYDLLGRRVATPVKGHIYLQGGKKFIAQ